MRVGDCQELVDEQGAGQRNSFQQECGVFLGQTLASIKALAVFRRRRLATRNVQQVYRALRLSCLRDFSLNEARFRRGSPFL